MFPSDSNRLHAQCSSDASRFHVCAFVRIICTRSNFGSELVLALFLFPFSLLDPLATMARMVDVFHIWCPLGEECSKKGRMLAKHANEDAVRAALLNHLQQSPYHQEVPEEEKVSLAASADVEIWPVEDWNDQAAGEETGQEEVKDELGDGDDEDGVTEQPWKKAKGGKSSGKQIAGFGKGYPSGSKGKGKVMGKPKNKGKGKDVAGMETRITEAVIQGLQQQQQQQPAQSSTMVAVQRLGSASSSSSGNVTISRVLAVSLVEHINRSVTALQHASRISHSAALAFDQEAITLTSAREALQRML